MNENVSSGDYSSQDWSEPLIFFENRENQIPTRTREASINNAQERIEDTLTEPNIMTQEMMLANYESGSKYPID